MTARALHLGLDVGTQGTKGVVIDAERGEVVARASASYELLHGLPAGAAEQHPATWIEAVRTVSRELLARLDRSRVRGVGVSGQQHGLVALDARDEVVRPAKLWCDTTTAEEAAELSKRFGREVPTGFTAPKLLWMKRREPERWARVRRVLLPHDYVNLRLTGRATMEAGDASGTGLFDPRARRFDVEAARSIDARVPEMLPELVAPGAPAGELSGEGAQLLGLEAGLPVASGGGDNMMSAIGSGATREGRLVASLGTSGTAFAYSSSPVVDPEGLIAPFCDSTGGWLPLLCVMNMTGVLEELRAGFGGEMDHAALAAEAEAVPPGCEGLSLLPYFAGERVPNLPHASGALLGIRPSLLRRAHLYRAALEGTSLAFALGVARLARLGVATEEVRLVGGGSKNALWRRILASALDAPIRRLAEPESAALGAAIQALWTAERLDGRASGADAVAARFVRLEDGVDEPERELTELYAERARRLEEHTARLFGSER